MSKRIVLLKIRIWMAVGVAKIGAVQFQHCTESFRPNYADELFAHMGFAIDS